jgi:RNA polymerase sigma-70 factor (ECF subfamily)
VLARLAGRRQPHAELSSESEEFWAAVRALPQRQAQAAALRFVYDMPVGDIAATLGTSEGTVEQHLSRARQSLAQTLGTTEEEQ